MVPTSSGDSKLSWPVSSNTMTALERQCVEPVSMAAAPTVAHTPAWIGTPPVPTPCGNTRWISSPIRRPSTEPVQISGTNEPPGRGSVIEIDANTV